MRLSAGLPKRAWKDSSPDTRFVPDQRCPWRKLGASVVDMQTAGRWADPKMPAHYARAELAERGAVARFFYGK